MYFELGSGLLNVFVCLKRRRNTDPRNIKKDPCHVDTGSVYLEHRSGLLNILGLSEQRNIARIRLTTNRICVTVTTDPCIVHGSVLLNIKVFLNKETLHGSATDPCTLYTDPPLRKQDPCIYNTDLGS